MATHMAYSRKGNLSILARRENNTAIEALHMVQLIYNTTPYQAICILRDIINKTVNAVSSWEMIVDTLVNNEYINIRAETAIAEDDDPMIMLITSDILLDAHTIKNAATDARRFINALRQAEMNIDKLDTMHITELAKQYADSTSIAVKIALRALSIC